MQPVIDNPFGRNVGSSLNHEDTVCVCLRTHRLVSSTVHQLPKLLSVEKNVFIWGGEKRNQFVKFLCSFFLLRYGGEFATRGT